jgi:hypothetical protein
MKRHFAGLSKAEQEKVEDEYHRMSPEDLELRSDMMNQPILRQIEESFTELSIPEQLRLIERLVHRVHENTLKQRDDADVQMAKMAADPDIEKELREIGQEFAAAESDGLEIA